MVKFLIEHPIAVTVTCVALLVLGIATSTQLPVSLLPDTPVPKISVHISKPNLSAQELENTIATPIRRYLLQTSHLENISSKTYNEYAVIEMDFAFGSDIDLAFLETNEKIDLALQQMPRDLQRPRVIKASATDIPAFYLNLTLKQTSNPGGDSKEISQEFIDLSNFSQQVIRKRLEQTPEVALVDMSGMVFPEIMITPDWNKLAALDISLEALENAIKQSDISLGNLTILDGQYQYNVRFSAAINNIRDIEEIFIKVEERVFRLKELVSVKQQPQKPEGYVIANGKQAITMAVIKRGDAQMNALKESLESLIKNFEYDYPHIVFSITRDQTRLLEYSVSNLKQGLVWSAALAFLVMFFFLRNARSPVLIGISIPTALIISLLLFYLFDISINIISLSGLILGVGMMVDNSIIVIDNISQHLEMGKSLKKACIIGVNEIFRPLLSSVLTTSAVFIPLIFISGISGALFYDQAIAVTIGLFTSLAVAITILPVYFFLFYRNSGEWKIDKLLRKLSGIPFTKIYEVGFVMVMRRQIMVWGLMALMVVLTVWLYSELPKRKLPEYEKNEILLRIDWNQSINLAESERRIKEVVDQVKTHLADYTALLGKQEFVLNQTEGKSPSEVNLYLHAHSSDDIAKLTMITEEYIRKHFPQAITEYKASENLFEMVFNDNQPFLVARLRPLANFGDDESIQLNNLMASLRKSPVGSFISEPEWQEYISLEVDYEKLLMYDVSIRRLYAELQSALNAHTILLIADNQFSVPVVIGSEEKSFGDILMQLQIENENGDKIPFRSLVRSSRDKSLSYITAGQEGVYYPVPVEMSPTEADWFMTHTKAVVQNNGLFEVDFTGSYFDTQKLMNEMVVILSISLLLLYFILAAQFESLKLPLIVLFEVPIDFFGALLFLWLFDSSINIMSMIGIIVMTGIIINDSILKVDTINQLRKGGMPLIPALHVAGKRRLKPILMTTITTILALVPLFFSSGMGNDIQKPFALTIIGGMTIGTLVSIYVVPMLYYNLENHKK